MPTPSNGRGRTTGCGDGSPSMRLEFLASFQARDTRTRTAACRADRHFSQPTASARPPGQPAGRLELDDRAGDPAEHLLEGEARRVLDPTSLRVAALNVA